MGYGKKRMAGRRSFLRLMTACAAGAITTSSLVSCVPTPTTVPAATLSPAATEVPKEATPAEKVTLRWWSYYEPATRCAQCPDIATAYQKQNPAVTIQVEHGGAAYSEKLASAFAAGDPPELYGTTHTTLLVQVSDGAVLELDDWYADSNMAEKIHPGAKAWCSVGGKLYGVSAWDLFVQEWYYNAAVFEELGLEEPKTEDDLYVIAEALKAKVRYPFLFGGASTWLWTELLSLPQAQLVGITPIIEGADKKDYHIPELEQAVEKCGRMFKEGLIPEDALGITADDVLTTFANGEVGFITFHTGWLPGIQKSVKDAGEKAKLDLFKDAVIFTEQPKSPWPAGYAMVWAVPKANKYVEQTLDFLTYLMSPEVQRSIAEAGLGIPPVPETWDAITDPLYQATIKHLGEATAESLFFVDFIHPRVNEAIYTSMLAMVKGEGTAAGVLDAMTEAIRAV
ncbi:MAG: ABC transporter substrate-binding protein [Anaerolineae bacterium]